MGAWHGAVVQIDRTKWARTKWEEHGAKLGKEHFDDRYHQYRDAGHYSGDGVQGNR